MAHTVLPTKHPNLAHVRISGDLTRDDMTCDAELGLGQGKPVYVIVETVDMNTHFPDDFVDLARAGFLVNPDLQHMAVVTTSSLLRSVALAAATLASSRDRMSTYASIAEAEARLTAMIKRRGL